MNVQIRVVGPKDECPQGGIRLTVSSRAPVLNPAGWRDLWLLSPFSLVQPDGIEVPGFGGVRSKTVENAWQFLKVWPGEMGWQKEEALEVFRSDCAIRYPRGRGKHAIAHYWYETGELLDYVTARLRIYLPLYLEFLELPDRMRVVERLRKHAASQAIYIWDFDSYDISRTDITNPFDVVFNTAKPFAHAFIVAFAVRGEVDAFLKYIADKRTMEPEERENVDQRDTHD